MTGLVLFLHGLRGDISHWADVPTYVGSQLSSFTTSGLEYSGEALSVADIERSASQVLTKIQNSYTGGDPIFLVGYSMGGLVAREVCLKLLLAAEDDPKKLLQRIPAVITFGTPLCGIRRGWRGAILARMNRHLTPKVAQLTKKFVFDRYKEGIEKARQKGIDGPKHFHFEIENDELVANHDQLAYTKDDANAGTIAGTHKGFLTTQEAQNEVADLILTKVEEVYNALGRANKPQAMAVPRYDLADRILLIACSNRKKSGGENFAGPEPTAWIPQPELRDQIKSKRASVLSILKASKLVNAFAKSGNRIHQGPNKEIRRGPDFGGVEAGGVYMPAWNRYDGRCYNPIPRESWLHHFQDTSQLSVLIMSGLYGWLDASDWIQDYDVHLTDSNKESGVSVSAMWTQLFTDTLSAYINSVYKDRKVKVFNFLCDNDYIDAVQWHKLPPTCSVYHLASPDCEDTNLLPAAGTMIDFMLRRPDGLDNVVRSTRESWTAYPLSDFGMPTPEHAETTVIFEATVGEARKNPKFPRST
jgi:cytoplasmic iron level regulating protein YaaA (DUF328/UPF0246 family)/pimeloyl-ACP methyl ester carboxylesterase